jgi:hypothetical protein
MRMALVPALILLLINSCHIIMMRIVNLLKNPLAVHPFSKFYAKKERKKVARRRKCSHEGNVCARD